MATMTKQHWTIFSGLRLSCHQASKWISNTLLFLVLSIHTLRHLLRFQLASYWPRWSGRLSLRLTKCWRRDSYNPSIWITFCDRWRRWKQTSPTRCRTLCIRVSYGETSKEKLQTSLHSLAVLHFRLKIKSQTYMMNLFYCIYNFSTITQTNLSKLEKLIISPILYAVGR